MRAALYARVSTTDKGQDVNLQLNELREFASRREFEFTEYIDQGVSGAKAKRPALDALVKAAKSRKIDVVIVWKLDRLGRSLVHLLHLLNEFQDLGVAFISLREQIDMTTAAGKLMAHLMGAFAEFERGMIQERVKAGIENARSKGRQIGRKKVPGSTIRKIIELHNDGLSLRGVAKKAKASLSVVQRTVGEYKAGTLDRDGLKTAPLSPEVFENPAAKVPVYSLNALVSGITSENKHDFADTDFGKPVGKEI